MSALTMGSLFDGSMGLAEYSAQIMAEAPELPTGPAM